LELLWLVVAVLASSFKSKVRLEVENAVLRHELIVLGRRLHGRVRLTNHDRWFFIQSIAGFHHSCRLSRSSGPRRSCVGIGPAFGATDVGNRVARDSQAACRHGDPDEWFQLPRASQAHDRADRYALGPRFWPWGYREGTPRSRVRSKAKPSRQAPLRMCSE
jgi:hypothetical protein